MAAESGSAALVHTSRSISFWLKMFCVGRAAVEASKKITRKKA
jgi:hypothetical protein